MAEIIKDILIGVGGFGAGALVGGQAYLLAEPVWAKNILKDLSIFRYEPTTDKIWPLDLRFVAAGGYGLEQYRTETAVYLAWRDTGIGAGDDDAWLGIGKRQDGRIVLGVYGYHLKVFYADKEIPASPPAGLHYRLVVVSPT